MKNYLEERTTEEQISTSINATVPVGTIITWAQDTPPANYLECDGSEISRTVYSDLFDRLGTLYGIGNGSTTFNIPDYRGEFLRGFDNGAGNDPDSASRTDPGNNETGGGGDNIGTKQDSEFGSHSHGTGKALAGSGGSGFGGGSDAENTSTDAQGGNETRPRNVYVMYCIKY